MSTPGNGVSGRNGDVLLGSTQVCEVKKWTWNPKMEVKEYVSNKTAGAKKRISSNKDGTGSIDGVWDPWDPITDHLDVGDEVTLKLQHYSGQFWLVPAIIESLSFDVDIETGDVEAWTANYSSTGVWTNPTALATTTTTTTAALFVGFEEAGELMPAAAGSQPPYQPPQGASSHQGSAAPGLDVGALAQQVATLLHGMGWGPTGGRSNPDHHEGEVKPPATPTRQASRSRGGPTTPQPHEASES